MTRLPEGSVTGRGEDGDLTVDAQVLAPRLGLSVAKLKAEMRRGIVYSRVERGEGADAGYWRITVTYRQHAVRVLVALERRGERLRLTRAGRVYGDAVAERLAPA